MITALLQSTAIMEVSEMGIDPTTISIATLFITVLALMLTQWRAARVEKTTAARDTVAMLTARVELLQNEVKELQSRMRDCEEARRNLAEENLFLTKKVLGLSPEDRFGQSSNQGGESRGERRFWQRRSDDRERDEHHDERRDSPRGGR